jgi:hypothetical protein
MEIFDREVVMHVWFIGSINYIGPMEEKSNSFDAPMVMKNCFWCVAMIETK